MEKNFPCAFELHTSGFVVFNAYNKKPVSNVLLTVPGWLHFNNKSSTLGAPIPAQLTQKTRCACVAPQTHTILRTLSSAQLLPLVCREDRKSEMSFCYLPQNMRTGHCWQPHWRLNLKLPQRTKVFISLRRKHES